MRTTAPGRPRVAPRRCALVAGLLVALASGLTACDLAGGSSPGTTTGTPALRDPGAADLTALEQRIEALDGVTDARLGYVGATVENGRSYTGRITSDATTADDLARILEASWRVLWDAADLRGGTLAIVVVNPQSGLGVDFARSGLPVNPTYEELEQRFGPRPTATP